MFAISFVSPLSLWPVDWRPPATEMQQGFLGLASLAHAGGAIRAHGDVGATGGGAGCSDLSNAVEVHVFGLSERIDGTNEKAPSGGTEGGFGVLAALSGAQTLGTTLPSQLGQAFRSFEQNGREAHGGGVCGRDIRKSRHSDMSSESGVARWLPREVAW
jgi:hypothetical protein